MTCDWNAYLNMIPPRLRETVDRLGRSELLELRLRIEQQPELVLLCGRKFLQDTVTEEDLKFCLNTASRYSPWTSSSVSDGYITSEGGHRIGICGETVWKNGVMTGISSATSLCIRVARDFMGISNMLPALNGSVLIIGKPCSGKTTLLRDLVRKLSFRYHVGVVDERGEIFPSKTGFNRGQGVDVLSGCVKAVGIELLIRSMSPDVVAVDEVTAKRDCDAMLYAGWCGVRLIATAHAASVDDLFHRSVYRPLAISGLFDHVITARVDKPPAVERMPVCT